MRDKRFSQDAQARSKHPEIVFTMCQSTGCSPSRCVFSRQWQMRFWLNSLTTWHLDERWWDGGKETEKDNGSEKSKWSKGGVESSLWTTVMLNKQRWTQMEKGIVKEKERDRSVGKSLSMSLLLITSIYNWIINHLCYYPITAAIELAMVWLNWVLTLWPLCDSPLFLCVCAAFALQVFAMKWKLLFSLYHVATVLQLTLGFGWGKDYLMYWIWIKPLSAFQHDLKLVNSDFKVVFFGLIWFFGLHKTIWAFDAQGKLGQRIQMEFNETK